MTFFNQMWHLYLDAELAFSVVSPVISYEDIMLTSLRVGSMTDHHLKVSEVALFGYPRGTG